MKSFEQIQETLGQLPNYPKTYLLGSTGAGKTSIVRAILDTVNDAFPSTLPTRTTVAPTEYVISANKPFKSTFIFKERDDIENSLIEILETTIDKAKNQENPSPDSLIEYLGETPDERFRLKYILPESILEEFSTYIIKSILPKINNIKELNLELIKPEIDYLLDRIFDVIIKKTKEICPDYELFSDKLYILDHIKIKKDFILSNKALLKSEENSISPLIEYARIEGNLSASWIPNELEFILIDGEGIGHNLKEVKNSLSTRHLDFFNFSDSIILVEKSDDPFISGGKNAIETIYINGYIKKFKLIFSKTDKLEVKDYKAALNRRIANVENALKDSHIPFNLTREQKYYLSNLNKPINEVNKQEIIRIFKNIQKDFLKKDENPIELEFDFETLFSNFNTTSFLNRWHKKLEYEHWTIIKAFTKRMLLKEGEYRYLKPILDYHTFIMQEVNIFLQNQDKNYLNSENSYAHNMIKQKFSILLLSYIRNLLMDDYANDWYKAYVESGYGSSKVRKMIIDQIFNSAIPKETEENDFTELKKEIKKFLIASGAEERSIPTKISIHEISIQHIYNTRNIEWSLNKNVNILIGKNGSGKSSVLKIIKAYLENDSEVLKKFKFPRIEIKVDKEYENPEDNTSANLINPLVQKIDIEYIDTFDTLPESLIECREKYENKQSDLDYKLANLLDVFNKYKIKSDKIFQEKNFKNKQEIERITTEIVNGNINEASKIKGLKENEEIIKADVYQALNNFRNIIDSMFKDTNKKINLELIEESFSISSSNGELKLIDLSSGEKQVLIIFLTILLKEHKPYILIMDEPENSLHSEWQIHFINNIRKLNKNVQLIIATHNPLLMLDREGDEIGKISINNDVIDTFGSGTKYLDVSATLLSYPQVSSLVGDGDMKKEINQLFKLKSQDELSPDEKNKIDELEIKLGSTVASNFIYDRHYLDFLKFIKDNKNIDFDKLTEISKEEMDELLGEFKDLFDD